MLMAEETVKCKQNSDTWDWMWAGACCSRCCFNKSLYSRFRSSVFCLCAENRILGNSGPSQLDLLHNRLT